PYEGLNEAMKAGLGAANQQRDDLAALVESLAQQVTELSSTVTALGRSQTRRMVSIQGQASARLTEFQEVAADPVNGYARASNLLALSA
ncbi:hypothetical protein, partial [Klebsiella michiganensis]|uniref:hypothetical protein n=1 Tax=Klebsiella michiganensis TaxID=1134687 RepID=UPI0013D4ECC9